jgi:hypothetical protein
VATDVLLLVQLPPVSESVKAELVSTQMDEIPDIAGITGVPRTVMVFDLMNGPHEFVPE